MRTNLVLNDDLLREARQYSDARTKSALAEEALRAFVAMRAAERRRRDYAKRLRHVQQALAGRRFREDGASILREDRERT
jgi:hypothetical protein